jgi:GNAT superfamily N-acetyltransferase
VRKKSLTLEAASAADVDDVLAVLNDAAAWLRASGLEQWPERFEPEWIEPAIENGETWLARVDGEVAGTITLEWDDPLWADVEGTAGYVHRIAVRRTARGLGVALLDWAAATAGALGCAYLRLDCLSSNSRLRAYYESRGFLHHSDVQDSRRAIVSRCQLPL